MKKFYIKTRVIYITILLGGLFFTLKTLKTFAAPTTLGRVTGSEKSEEVVEEFYDPNVDYSRFLGRATDKDITQHILKVFSKNENAKFFLSGDKVSFELMHGNSGRCVGYVRRVDGRYFVLSVEDFEPCWHSSKYFRRGTILNFYSKDLGKRVREASVHRRLLLTRKKDFLSQLGKVNDFIWTYNQQKLKLATRYDREIEALEKRKLEALQLLNGKRKDQINLQRELVYRLDTIDKDLDFYIIEKYDRKVDRWRADQDLGLPVGNRPQKNLSN